MSFPETTRWPAISLERLWPSMRTRAIIAGALALGIAFATAVLTLSSPHAISPQALALYRVQQILTYALIGLLWWRRRPGNAIGTILILTAFAWGTAGLLSATNPLVFTLGVALEPAVAFSGFYLAVCYPQQRLQSVGDRLVATGFAIVAIATPFMLMLTPAASPRGALNGCATACPANAFFVADMPWLASALWALTIGAALVAGAAAGLMVLVRLRTASPARRRSLLPVAGVAVLLFLTFTAYHTSRWVVSAPAIANQFELLLAAARIIFPFGFLFALVEADLWAGSAGRRLMAELLRGPSPHRWREAIASSLEDPTANIGYLDVASDRYVDADGAELSSDAPGRLTIDVMKGSEVIAKIVTDPILAHEPELISAASEATLAAIEHGRLESKVDELQVRASAAGAAERRRIQRDLHDSAQQRLVALRVHMSLAEERGSTSEHREQLAQFGRQLDDALEEIRTVARGEYPLSLERNGLGPAITEVCKGLSDRITVIDRGTSRYPEATERAVYYCCTEAIQNSLKHAGPGARITVSLTDRRGDVFFIVADDGSGFDSSQAMGTGLQNLHERIAQAGGQVVISSRLGAGTRVSGSAPGKAA